ncbi:MAG: trypsin-like peptidase domain-containing protein [Desulfosudis oleivorans]|nr:trypsin-like peptidase domain-containing protein [Desulfosudis oleivorans]
MPASFSQLAEAVGPAVVNIRTVKTLKGGGPVFRHFQREPGRTREPVQRVLRALFRRRDAAGVQASRVWGRASSSTRTATVVTNNHVVENADQIKVRLVDEREFDAKIIGRDPKTDLALIQIEGAKDLSPLKMGDSETAGGRQLGAGRGQPLRSGADRHGRHRQRQGPLHRRRPLRRLHPDGRLHQPRQQRRAAAEHERRGDRHQHRHRRPGPGDRLRHPGQPGAEHHRPAQGARRASPAAGWGSAIQDLTPELAAVLRHQGPEGRAGDPGLPGRPGRRAPASSPRTSSWR